jgi:hypothetical protein
MMEDDDDDANESLGMRKEPQLTAFEEDPYRTMVGVQPPSQILLSPSDSTRFRTSPVYIDP